MMWVRGVLYDVFGPGQTALLSNVLDGRQWSPDYLFCLRHHSLNSRKYRRFCAFFTRKVMLRDHDKLSVICNRELGATGHLHCGVTDEEWCVMVLVFPEFCNDLHSLVDIQDQVVGVAPLHQLSHVGILFLQMCQA